VLTAPLSPCAAKKHSAWMLKVIPIMDIVISGRGNSPDNMTMICHEQKRTPDEKDIVSLIVPHS
jgi:hypothetical protein